MKLSSHFAAIAALIGPPVAAAVAVVGLLFYAAGGCTGVNSPGAQLAICVLNTYGLDVAQGMTPEAAIVDAGIQCGIAAVDAGKVVAASNAMHMRISEPKTDGGGK